MTIEQKGEGGETERDRGNAAGRWEVNNVGGIWLHTKRGVRQWRHGKRKGIKKEGEYRREKEEESLFNSQKLD